MGQTRDIIVVVVVLVGLTAWVIWGYASWWRTDRNFSAAIRCSFGGFTLASLSALLEIGSGGYAQFHTFRFYDPVLMTVYHLGFLPQRWAWSFQWADSQAKARCVGKLPHSRR